MPADSLPAAFTRAQAKQAGLAWRELQALLQDGTYIPLGRGLMMRSNVAADPDLVEVAMRASDATLCLVSALAHHDLTDEIPRTMHVAIPRGRRAPRTSAPVTWHAFAAETFTIGRTEIKVVDDLTLGLFDPIRSIVDAFRMSHLEGRDLALEALRRWLRRRGSSPARLLATAEHFPTSLKSIRLALEVLL